MGAKDQLFGLYGFLGSNIVNNGEKTPFSQFKFVSRGGFCLFILHYLTYQTRN